MTIRAQQQLLLGRYIHDRSQRHQQQHQQPSATTGNAPTPPLTLWDVYNYNFYHGGMTDDDSDTTTSTTSSTTTIASFTNTTGSSSIYSSSETSTPSQSPQLLSCTESPQPSAEKATPSRTALLQAVVKSSSLDSSAKTATTLTDTLTVIPETQQEQIQHLHGHVNAHAHKPLTPNPLGPSVSVDVRMYNSIHISPDPKIYRSAISNTTQPTLTPPSTTSSDSNTSVWTGSLVKTGSLSLPARLLKQNLPLLLLLQQQMHLRQLQQPQTQQLHTDENTTAVECAPSAIAPIKEITPLQEPVTPQNLLLNVIENFPWCRFIEEVNRAFGKCTYSAERSKGGVVNSFAIEKSHGIPLSSINLVPQMTQNQIAACLRHLVEKGYLTVEAEEFRRTPNWEMLYTQNSQAWKTLKHRYREDRIGFMEPEITKGEETVGPLKKTGEQDPVKQTMEQTFYNVVYSGSANAVKADAGQDPQQQQPQPQAQPQPQTQPEPPLHVQSEVHQQTPPTTHSADDIEEVRAINKIPKRNAGTKPVVQEGDRHRKSEKFTPQQQVKFEDRTKTQGDLVAEVGAFFSGFFEMSFDPCANGTAVTSESFEDVLPYVSPMGIALGVILTVAIVISILPQHVKILRKRTHVGLSFLALFLQNVNQFSCAMNSVLLKEPQFKACVVLSFGQCLPSLLSFIQLFATWLFTAPIYVYYLIFFQHDKSKANILLWRLSLLFFGLWLLYFATLVGMIIGISYADGMCGDVTVTFGKVLGILSLVLTIVQWSPQIWTTWRAKSAGSMSTLMVALQAPGSAVIVVFMACITKDNVTTWASYLASAIQLFILLFILVYYEIRDYRAKKAKGYAPINTESEDVVKVGDSLTASDRDGENVSINSEPTSTTTYNSTAASTSTPQDVTNNSTYGQSGASSDTTNE
ncbi:PQ loop repeat protein [Pelomyxa schiedti]|nr:PQ loop repeat protein [Pelomyxa schiedti]